MKGWIIYKRKQEELTTNDHGVLRLLATAPAFNMDLHVFSPPQLSLISGSDSLPTMVVDGAAMALPDFVMPRIGAESTAFTIALIRQLELLGVPSINTAAAIELVKDKMRVSQLLKANHLPTPKTMLLNLPIAFEIVEETIGFPLVIKHISSARGIGVHLCETASSFRDLMGLLNEQIIQHLMVQQFISNSYGRDLRVFVIGNEVVGCMLRTAKEGFKANYSLGGEVKAYPINDEIARLALRCTEVTGLAISGIDLLFEADGHFTICEANSSPGFKGMEEATHDDVANKILSYVSEKLDKKKTKSIAAGMQSQNSSRLRGNG